MAKPVRCFISLGANINKPKQQIASAIAALRQLPLSQLSAVSPWYETAAIGNTDQDNFINAVAALDTQLSAIGLLQSLQAIEQQQGRIRTERWGPRSLDLDLLVYGQEQWRSAHLWLPHPRMLERKFVLQPLRDIAPQLYLNGTHIGVYLAQCAAQMVTPINPVSARELNYVG